MRNSGIIHIVGGGMTGLTLGYRLSQRGIKVVVHERDPYLGGHTSEGELQGIPVEKFYHCVLPTDTRLLSLFDELGLRDKIKWTRTRTGFFVDGRSLEMTTTADFLRFPAINVWDRIRLGWTLVYCGLLPDWRPLDNEPIGTFLRRHGGQRLFKAVWEPLLIAKLGTQYDRFAASFIWATVYRMLSARKAKGRSEKLGFVSGRYGQVFRALRQAIESNGGSVRVGSAVESVEQVKSEKGIGWKISVGGDVLDASGVVLCIPAHLAVQLLGKSMLESVSDLKRVEYLGVVCEALLLKRALTPYYVLNLANRALPFTGIIETSNLTGKNEFAGHALVYLPRYRDQNSADWDTDDMKIHKENLSALRQVVGNDLQEDDILAWQVNRARYVQPIHPLGWGNQLPRVRLAEGLVYLSTAQIHPWPVFNDEAVGNVESHLKEILGILGNT